MQKKLGAKIGVILTFPLLANIPAPANAATDATSPFVRERCIPWQIVTVPTDESEGFTGIDGMSASDFWAVGDSSSFPHVPTIRHWDGTDWTVPVVEARDGWLYDVDVLSPSDAWAVGTRLNFNRTLALRWNGSAWVSVPIPSPRHYYDGLRGVSGTGPSDVWAVGLTGYSNGLITHWDGTRWSVVPFQRYPEGENFHDVLAVAADDAWAVGKRFSGLTANPFIQHWDGSAWTDVRFPDAEEHGILVDLDASSADEVWAVGDDYVGGSFVFRWDGARWHRLTRIPFSSVGVLASVSVLSPSDVWVAGTRGVAGPPIAGHWDGATWRVTPIEDENAWFNTIRAFTSTDVWAGGHVGGLGIRAERLIGCR